MLPYATNLLKLTQNQTHLRPSVAVYYVTEQCNLNCAYCEDFGAHRNPNNARPPTLENAQHILRVIRSGMDALFMTGGEPLTHPHLDQLAAYAKTELKFRELTMISNGLLLEGRDALLWHIDRLIISLDSINPQHWSQTIGVPPASAQNILKNIAAAAKLQKSHRFVMSVNAVLSPATLENAEAVLDFCIQNNLHISFSPQSVNNWPHYELTVSPAYPAFIQKMLELKRRGAPIIGSDAYLRTLADFRPYQCYPTLVPRIYPHGDLAYPCRPLEKADNGQGGRAINLLNVKNWDEAWQQAHATYGDPPTMCTSCFQQCYAEPSLMQSQPLNLLWEVLRYPASRRFNLTTYAPG